MPSLLTPSLLLLTLSIVLSAQASDDYLLYVWREGLDTSLCPDYEPRSTHPECYTHNWETPEARAKLWPALSPHGGHSVRYILLGGVTDKLEANLCHPDVKAMVAESHAHNAEVYALFAASDAAFSEIGLIPYAVDYNEQCATDASERFDGISVNNEHFGAIKSSQCDIANPDDRTEMITFLDNLYAAAQVAHDAGLPFHFSLGWHWSYCSVSDDIPNNLTWGPPGSAAVSRPANEHMLSIVDSVDVQVAYTLASTMASRANTAGFQYALANQKRFHLLAYVSDAGDCRITFFPGQDTDGSDCDFVEYSEANMMATLEEARTILDTTDGLGGIHAYRNLYSTGLTDLFPIHALAGDDDDDDTTPPPMTLTMWRMCEIGWTITATPNSDVVLYGGRKVDNGDTVDVPGCGTFDLDLRVVATVTYTADENGVIDEAVEVKAELCADIYVRAVDTATCRYA